MTQGLVHLPDELVDVVFTVSVVTTLHEMPEFGRSPATSRVGEFEWPKEVGGLFEVWSNSEDLVDQVFDRQDIILAQGRFDDLVARQRNSLLVNLAISALVDQLSDRLQVWLAVCDVRLDELEHLQGRPVGLNKDTVVDLEETEKLEDFAGLWGDLVDTLDSDHKVHLRLCGDIKVTSFSCSPSEADFLLLALFVFPYVCLSTLKDDPPLGDVGLASSSHSCKFFFPSLFIVLSLFEKCLRDFDMCSRWDAISVCSFQVIRWWH